MLKHSLLWGVISSFLLSAACGSAPIVDLYATPTSPVPIPAETSGTVSFMVFGDPAELKAYQTLVAAFEQQTPSINVELIHIPSQTDYRQRLAADFAAGVPANVVLINYRRVSGFANQRVLEPIGPYLNQSSVIQMEDFFPEATQAFIWRGQLVCLPQNMSSLVVYYNADLFRAAQVPLPTAEWTWDDFLTTAKALTKDTNGDGRADQYGVTTEPELIRVAPFVWQNLGELAPEDDIKGPTRLALDSPAALEAVQWFVDWQVKHHIAPSAEEERSEASEDRFMHGGAAMYLNSRRIVPTLREAAQFDWDVAPLPMGKQKATILHADAYCLTAATPNKAAAWKFIEFANAPEGQTIIAATGRTVPSLIAVAQSPAFLDPTVKPKSSQVFLDVIPVTRMVPNVPTWVEIEDRVTAEVERAYYGNATVEEAMKSAVEQTTRLFNEDE